VLRAAALARAALRPQHERHRELPAGHEVRLRRLVDELVERERDEVDEHDLDDRAQARLRRPIAIPQIAASLIGVLRTRSARTPRPARGRAPRAALGDVLAEHEHASVRAHRAASVAVIASR
jgi:hypothetical protein